MFIVLILENNVSIVLVQNFLDILGTVEKWVLFSTQNPQRTKTFIIETLHVWYRV